jgi:ParB-like nuclease domain
MGSISALGFCAPILVGRDNLVLDGEVRVEAAKALCLTTVPCIRIDHLTDEEQRTLRLAVNRLSEKGEWDLTELKIEFEELILAEAPIEISGFAPEQIDQILLGEAIEGAEEGPLAPEPVPSRSPVAAIFFASAAIALSVATPPTRRFWRA